MEVLVVLYVEERSKFPIFETKIVTQATRIAIKNLKEFRSEELFGATSARLLSREQLPTVGFDHVRIANGAELKPHTHAASETFIYILEGTAIVTLDDNNSRIRAGDTIYIPAGVSHGFSTPDEAIALLSVQSPPIYPEDSMPDIYFGNLNSFQENSMQPAPNVEQQTSTQILTELLSLLSQNVQTWVDLFAEDAVLESPYAPGTPERLEGKQAIYNFVKNALAQMQDLRFTNIRVYPTTNPDLLWAEFHGEAVAIATGRSYQQDYVLRLETREGKIVRYRTYSNPLSAIEAWGSTQDLHSFFNADNAESAE